MNAWKRGLLVGGTLIALALAAGVFVGVGGMAVARPDEKETAKPISAWDIVEKLDGKEAKATVVEVTLGPGQAGESLPLLTLAVAQRMTPAGLAAVIHCYPTQVEAIQRVADQART
jgi:hypothetical protein